ncbi:MAG: hypothetical protein E3J78_06705, partial [Candidatus Cloacimonadota bacterium]
MALTFTERALALATRALSVKPGETDMNKSFSAPWGIPLKITTAFSVLLLLGVALIGLLAGPREGTAGNIWYLSMIGSPLCILIGLVFFMVRGYVLS